MSSHLQHSVLFYDKDKILLKSLTKFIARGLEKNEGCIVIATKSHRKSLENLLKQAGIDVTEVLLRKDLILLDATETLSNFMFMGKPNQSNFDNSVGKVLLDMAKSKQHIRAFGEMVNLLWNQGNESGALALEEMWNNLSVKIPFLLFCAYSTDYKFRSFEIEDFQKIFSHHTNSLINNPETQDIISAKVIDTGRDGLIVELPDKKQVGISFDQLVT